MRIVFGIARIILFSSIACVSLVGETVTTAAEPLVSALYAFVTVRFRQRLLAES
jgi:hypothetical protein